jgi:hypothetical protein
VGSTDETGADELLLWGASRGSCELPWRAPPVGTSQCGGARTSACSSERDGGTCGLGARWREHNDGGVLRHGLCDGGAGGRSGRCECTTAARTAAACGTVDCATAAWRGLCDLCSSERCTAVRCERDRRKNDLSLPNAIFTLSNTSFRGWTPFLLKKRFLLFFSSSLFN